MRHITLLLGLLLALCLTSSAYAEDFSSLITQLPQGSFKEREQLITTLAATGDVRAVPVLEALQAGDLYVRKADGKIFIAKASGPNLDLTDAETNQKAGTGPKEQFEKIKINNGLRRTIGNAIGNLTLLSGDAATRQKALLTIIKSGDASTLPALESAIPNETDPATKQLLQQAAAAATLKSDRSTEEKLTAIKTLSTRIDREIAGQLTAYAATAAEPMKSAALEAAQKIDRSLSRWSVAQNIWYGLSLGSVLLLAAVGLAITFGVMGVINMAHGEMVMLGAYTTYMVQQAFLAFLPHFTDYALLAAVPAAFLVSALVGIAIERSIIRFLYGRPLETLLATGGVSLILQQAVRSIFGPTNKEVKPPSWMSGSIELANGLSLTMNRVVILLFALSVFAALLLLMKRSAFGLQMRAVALNRPMASAMGVRSARVDALTFGLGSGIAGLAGVALSLIDNVSPNLGQAYIMDSFLVVVFGGVGNLWGTFAGAFTLGIANKFLEPFAGAVLAKIIILVAVILFIQKRPRGLFAMKGRWVNT